MSSAQASESGGGGAQLRHQPVSTQSYKIITQFGDMLIVKQGIQQHQPAAHPPHGPDQADQKHPHQSRPVIMTFHDLGLNSELQFATFCECDEVKLMLQTFTIIHVNFVGQEFVGGAGSAAAARAAPNLPDDFKYPTVEQMAECVVDICAQMRVRSFIALAVGAGAHIVSSLALLRPDLVHGLFLINPVISSCSITEWLYFKMSAIASNHQIGFHHAAGPQPDDADSPPPAALARPQHHQTSGLRRFLNAAARLPHFHHSHAHHHAGDDADSLASASSQQQQQRQASPDLASDSLSVASTSESPGGRPASGGAPSSRLRQLILSRNFKMNAAAGQQPADADSARARQKASDAQSNCSVGSEQSASKWAGKRPPLEYLMYHHFGGASFQRYRRPSQQGAGSGGNTSSSESGSPVTHKGAAAKKSSRDRRHNNGEDSRDTESLKEGGSTQLQRSSSVRRSSGGSGASPAGSRRESPAAGLLRRRQANSIESQSQGSLPGLAASPSRGSSTALAGHQGRYQRRSNSVCLSASYLASFSNERQRMAYVQAVYRQYFSQLNAHNLWLFAQSFVKRRTLNLRKDCGAAAHAAAAAAALGTSICAAFVGGIAPSTASLSASSSSAGGPQQQQPGEQQQVADPAATETGSLSSDQQLAAQQQRPAGKQPAPQALVAGTKVKRTFTCQTLIMCSSVQIHCERALKLMSLLNPLQATWIKTDQLLVLEEKPEKVCQALRLFLQGIGYSMSTYERRLRLSSAHGSASSAESTCSARSLNGGAAVAVL